jgi:hypothetical protein
MARLPEPLLLLCTPGLERKGFWIIWFLSGYIQYFSKLGFTVFSRNT